MCLLFKICLNFSHPVPILDTHTNYGELHAILVKISVSSEQSDPFFAIVAAPRENFGVKVQTFVFTEDASFGLVR